MAERNRFSNCCARTMLALAAIAGLSVCQTASAVGTPAGTVIEGTATVDYLLSGNPATAVSNTTTILVAERIDVVATLQSPQLAVNSGDTSQALLFTLTNTGNGSESFSLIVDNVLGGDDFDPLAAVPAIYFDTDASGDLTTGDEAYAAGVNDPVLAADASVDLFIVNDIPSGLVNADIGRSQLVATSQTGSGAAGTVYTGAGDGGVDAVIGTTGGEALEVGEYIVSDVMISVVKDQQVADPYGGTEPVPGATVTYTMSVEVLGPGTAVASALSDAIPEFTSFVPGSIALNGASLTDAPDADAGVFDTSGTPTVVVQLGDLVAADGAQTIVFQVTID